MGERQHPFGAVACIEPWNADTPPQTTADLRQPEETT